MSFIGGPLPNLGSNNSSPSMTSVLNTIKNNPGKKDDGIGDTERPTRMQKFAEAVDKSLKYKKQKEIDAEIGAETDKDKDLEAAGQKGFKISPDTTVLSGYRDPGFTLKGQKGRSFGGLIGTLGGAAIGLANPAIGAAMGSSIGSRVGSYFD